MAGDAGLIYGIGPLEDVGQMLQGFPLASGVPERSGDRQV